MATYCEPNASWNKGKWSGSVQVNAGGKRKRLTTGDAFSVNIATLISDSICQGFQNCLSTSFQCVHGGHLANFRDYCEVETITVKNFDQLLIFFGTNDISSETSSDTPANVVTSLGNAIRYIRGINPNVRVGICEIMPRPCDQIASRSPVKRIKERGASLLKAHRDTNDAMARWCFDHGYPFFHASSCLKGGDKSVPLFREDNLHLSDKG